MHQKWLISHDCQRAMATLLAMGRYPTVAEQRSFQEAAASRRKERGGGPENYSVVDGVARIAIVGLLTAEPDIWAWWTGQANTLYGDIAESVALAENDPAVKSIEYFVDSPGGTVDGLEEARNAVDQAKKPRTVFAAQAASGGYWLGVRAARGGQFIAVSPMASFGSIGVAVTMMDMKAYGYVAIASTDAPHKRPDVSTEEGVKIVQGELDQIHDEFANDVASARGVTREKVNADFGRGGVMLAELALKAGMIDAVAPRPKPARVSPAVEESKPPVATGETGDGKRVVNPPQPGLTKGQKLMDADKLKSEHPELFAKVLAMGVAQERERASAHIIFAEGSGDTEYALKCIQDGTSATDARVNAKHFASAMRRGALQARSEDGESVEKATKGAVVKDTPENPEVSDDDALADHMEAMFPSGRA